MKRPLNRRRPWLALLVPALLALSLMPGRWVEALTGPARHTVHWFLSPFTGALTSVGTALRQPADLPFDIIYGDEEQALLRYTRHLEQRVWELEEQLALQRTVPRNLLPGHDPLVAHVIRVDLYPSAHRTLTIDRGRRHGVLPGQVVTADQLNLVGRVVEAGPTTATVQLILSEGTALQVRIVPPVAGPSPRELPALLKVDPQGHGFFDRTGMDDPVQSGDLAHLNDPAWPRVAGGFVVGKVTAVEPDPDDSLRRRIVVRPLRSLPHLTMVVVHVPAEARGAPAPHEEGA